MQFHLILTLVLVYRASVISTAYRIVLFDQRGCGKSTPFASLDENTTWDLVRDMELIRKEIGVEKWLLFGGSWGSTLALAYAQTHPERCHALVLRGIFTLRQAELDWFYERHGAAMLYPDAFDKYVAGLPAELQESPSLLDAFHGILTGNDQAALNKAAVAWSTWEGTLSTFPRPVSTLTNVAATSTKDDSAKKVSKYSDAQFALAFARIESHYFFNKGFFPEGHVLSAKRMEAIRNIKGVIVQGRWDMVCPQKTAHDLKKAWGDAAELIVVEGAGHSTFEPGIAERLVEATNRFAKEFSVA